jgi:hypothetical protein
MLPGMKPSLRFVLAALPLACGGSVAASGDAGPDAPADVTSDVKPQDAQPDALPFQCSGECGAFVFTKLFAGDSSRSFVPSNQAWKQFGHDIDGKATISSSTDVCKRAGGAPSSVQTDGDNGIDNSFSANIVPIIQSAGSVANLSKPWSDGISQQGTRTLILSLPALGAGATQPSLSGAPFLTMPLGAAPKLDGSDLWPISSTSVTNGNLAQPTAPLPGGALSADAYDSGRGGAGVLLVSIPFGGVPWNLPVRRVRITGTLSADHTHITDGQLSGVIVAEELITELKLIAGAISQSLCGSAFDGIAQQMRQTQDILADGTQNPAVSCDAISIGLGFEAVRVKPGGIVDDPPPPNPCP